MILRRRIMVLGGGDSGGYVDLGLPSGLLWAQGNICRDANGSYRIGLPQEYGCFFSWGNIIGHNDTSGFNDTYDFSETNYNSTPGKSLTTSISPTDAEHDAALATLGSPWLLPTKNDFQELYDNTDNEWVTNFEGTGIKGIKFMKKTDHSVYIFLPASGNCNSTTPNNRGTDCRYYSSSRYNSTYAYYLYGRSDSIEPQSHANSRRLGNSIRPVQFPRQDITITLNPTDGTSASGISVTVTDSEGATHTGTTDSNGRVALQGVANGSAVVAAEGRKLTPTSITISSAVKAFTLDCEEITILTGYIILDQTSSDPTTKVLDESGHTYNNYQRPAVIDAIRAASHCYVGTFANNKMTLKQLDDTDGTKYADGTSAASDIASTSKDVFMRLPFFFTRVSTYATDKIKIEFAFDPNQTVTTTAQPDGNGWKQWGGNDLIGKYEAYEESNKTYSISGKTSTGSVSQANMKSHARARGTGFTLVKWRHQNLMAILFYAYYGHTNCQSLIGSGANSNNKSTGLKNSLGMTDTTSANGNTDNIVFWGLENWWGNKYEWVDNVVVNSGTWVITEDDGTTRTPTGTMAAAGSWVYPSKFVLNDDLDVIGASGQTGGSDSTGYCDGQYIANSSSRVVARSYSYAYANGGVAFVNAFYGSSNTSANVGSRLAFTGTIEIS